MRRHIESHPSNAAEIFETYKDRLVKIPNEETGEMEEWKVVGGSTDNGQEAVILHFKGDPGSIIGPKTMSLVEFRTLLEQQ